MALLVCRFLTPRAGAGMGWAGGASIPTPNPRGRLTGSPLTSTLAPNVETCSPLPFLPHPSSSLFPSCLFTSFLLFLTSFHFCPCLPLLFLFNPHPTLFPWSGIHRSTTMGPSRLLSLPGSQLLHLSRVGGDYNVPFTGL